MTPPLRLDQARRIALAAQGFAAGRPQGSVGVRHFRAVLGRVGLVQLDSVNVLARAHYLPFFSRLGPYRREALDRWAWGSGELFEYWGHEASLIPIDRHPLFRHRMAGGWHWPGIERLGREHPGFVEQVLDEVHRRGPLRVGDLEDDHRPAGGWWEWGKAKLALEWLFLTGRLTVSHRTHFTRYYDLPERVHPAALEAPTPPDDAARAELLMLAAAHHGIGTAADLADYYRIRPATARPLLAALAAAGRLEEVEVEGWKGPVYRHPEARLPRRVEGAALLSPFDPLVWNRDRAERLFGFRYRIEIYVPEHKRTHGYYVLPFLLDGGLVARVDLKADRGTGALVVRGAYLEAGHDRARVAGALATELATMAGWLGLGEVRVEPRGDLAGTLGAAVAL